VKVGGNMKLDDYKTGFHIGMHGLGFADGVSKKNTADVFDIWYKRGCRFFETDVAFTDDGEIVLLAHDFEDKYLHRLEIFEKPNIIGWTRDYVEKLTVGNRKHGVHFLFWDDFISIIKKHTDCVFMVDPYGRSKSEIEIIAKKLHELVCVYPDTDERVMLEVYTQEDVRQIKARYPDIRIIACIEEEGYNCFCGKDDQTVDIFSDICIDFISCPYRFVDNNRDVIHYCNNNNIGVLSFSRYDTGRTYKKKAGINVNLVDIYTGEKGKRYLYRIPVSMIQYIFHRIRMIRLKKNYRNGGRMK